MNSLKVKCCFCLSVSNPPYTNLHTKNKDNLTYFEKINSTLKISPVIDEDSDFVLCKKCCDRIDIIFKFNKACCINFKKLISYTTRSKKRKTSAADEKIFFNNTETENTFDTLFNDNSNSTFSDGIINDLENLEVKKENELPLTEEKTENFLLHEPKIEIDETNKKILEENLQKTNLKDKKPKTSGPKNGIKQEIQEKLECEFCKKVFDHKHQLKRHSLIHTAEKEHTCDECHKSFARKDQLNRHKIIHTGQKLYACEICQRAFNVKSNLEVHKKSHTDIKEYKCEDCGKLFARKEYLKTHMLIHSDIKMHLCDNCGMRLRTKSQLIEHKRVHTSIRSFTCEICSKSFYTKKNLNQHKLIHTDKMFSCDLCGKQFRIKYDLDCHKRIHSGNKPYVCDICGKAFNKRSYLDQHRRIHTGVKPYECDQCNKCFIQKVGLVRHKLTHNRV